MSGGLLLDGLALHGGDGVGQLHGLPVQLVKLNIQGMGLVRPAKALVEGGGGAQDGALVEHGGLRRSKELGKAAVRRLVMPVPSVVQRVRIGDAVLVNALGRGPFKRALQLKVPAIQSDGVLPAVGDHNQAGNDLPGINLALAPPVGKHVQKYGLGGVILAQRQKYFRIAVSGRDDVLLGEPVDGGKRFLYLRARPVQKPDVRQDHGGVVEHGIIKAQVAFVFAYQAEPLQRIAVRGGIVLCDGAAKDGVV